MPRSIILNSSNIVPNSGNSTFVYNFPLGGIHFQDELIAVQQVSFYNSVFNISVANNNNYFQYRWVDGTLNTVAIPDSYLEVAEINAYMQSIMISKSHYLISSTGEFVYLIQLVVNPARYADQVNCFLISTAIATANSWTLPVGATWVLPIASICPIFIVPQTQFQSLIGFAYGNYPNAVITGAQPGQTQVPSYLTTQSFLSTSPPQIIPQPSYLATCSLVNNRLAIPSQLIYSVSPSGVAFGELYVNQINDLAFNKVENGTYTNFSFRFVDSLGNAIIFQDPNFLILIVLKNIVELH